MTTSCGLRSACSSIGPALFHSAVFCLTLVSVPFNLAAQTADPSQLGRPLAMVEGQAVYEKQFPAALQAQLERIRYEEFELKRKAVNDLVAQRLLEAEAKKKGLNADKLLEMEADAGVADPTQGELEEYYRDQKERTTQPFDEAKAKLKETLRQERIQAAREAYVRHLWEQADVAVFLQPPRVEVNYDPGRVIGRSGLPVTIIEFADFSCPFCRKSDLTLKEVVAKYPGKVSIAYRDFPLRETHPEAQVAAEAARCAGDQGKFWEYHDLLFETQGGHSRERLLEDAQKLKLNERRFQLCLDTSKYKAEIERDVQDAIAAGVTGTPTFFINGIPLAGAQPASAFEKIIDEELRLVNRERAQRLLPTPGSEKSRHAEP